MGSSYGRNTPVDFPSREAYLCQSNEHIKQIAQTSNNDMAGGARFTNHYSTAFILKTSKWVSILTAPWSIHQRENAEPFWEATALSEPGRFSKMRSPSFFYVHVTCPISIWNLKSTMFNYNLIFTIYNTKIQNYSLQKFAITNYKRMIYSHLIVQTIHGNNSIFTVYNHKNHPYSLQNFTMTI